MSSPWDRNNLQQQGDLPPALKELMVQKKQDMIDKMTLDVLWARLEGYGAVDANTKELIESKATSFKQKDALIDHIKKGPMWRFHAFLRSLARANQEFILRVVGYGDDISLYMADEECLLPAASTTSGMQASGSANHTSVVSTAQDAPIEVSEEDEDKLKAYLDDIAPDVISTIRLDAEFIARLKKGGSLANSVEEDITNVHTKKGDRVNILVNFLKEDPAVNMKKFFSALKLSNQQRVLRNYDKPEIRRILGYPLTGQLIDVVPK